MGACDAGVNHSQPWVNQFYSEAWSFEHTCYYTKQKLYLSLLEEKEKVGGFQGEECGTDIYHERHSAKVWS